MQTVYEIRKNNESVSYYKFYQHYKAAKQEVDEMNHQFISNVMREVNRMNGAIRGANRHKFQEMIESVAKPPWTVKKHNVDSSWN